MVGEPIQLTNFILHIRCVILGSNRDIHITNYVVINWEMNHNATMGHCLVCQLLIVHDPELPGRFVMIAVIRQTVRLP